MKFLSQLRRLPWRFREQSRARKSRSRLRAPLALEALETRDLLSATTVNLVANPSFETPDLTGVNEANSLPLSNLNGWTEFNLQTSPGSNGTFAIQSGTQSPLSLVTVPGPTDGTHQVMLDQQDLTPLVPGAPTNPNAASTYAGAHALYQDVFVPAGTTSLTLSFSLYINSAAPFVTPADGHLDEPFARGVADQQVRVDIMDPTDPNGVLATDNAGVLQNIFQTTPLTAQQFGPQTFTMTINPGIYGNQTQGRTIRIRFAASNNQGKLIVGVDNVKLTATFTDQAPGVTNLQLRNPSFLSGPSNTPESNDPTVTGRVTDTGSVNSVTKVDFDVNGDGFGGADDVIVSTFDANGFFVANLPRTLLPGVHTIPVQVTNASGLTATTNFTFIKQGPSLDTWEPQGPDPISTLGSMSYPTVTGNVTGVVSDPSDPSGNTLYLASDAGGVWKTVDGGNDWVAETDNVLDPNGQRVPEGIGAITLGHAEINGADTTVVYAATGVANTLIPTGGDGILRSTDGGVTWTDVGQSVFKGAHISSIVVDPTVAVDPNNPTSGNGLNFLPVFVAVSWFDDPNKQPGVYQSNDGGATWTLITLPGSNMFLPDQRTTLAAAGVTQLASVTSLVIDPHSTPGNDQLIAGIGNIGETGAGAVKSAGVWFFAPGSNNVPAWTLEEGGKNPAVQNSTLPAGLDANNDILGSVKVAIAPGQVGPGQNIIYVTIATPPTGAAGASPGGFNGGQVTANSVHNAGAGVSGLYKTKDSFSTFTKVMLDQFITFVTNKNNVANPLYQPITLDGNYANNAGMLMVDASDPNVVYVGGSQLIGVSGGHGLIRVDTGDMRDSTYVDRFDGVNDIPNDGDDIVKAGIAELEWRSEHSGAADPTHLGDYLKTSAEVFYNDNGADGNRFFGEGVYWYDLSEAGVNSSGAKTFLPTTINSLSLDSQGRLLVGTFNGVWRGTEQGFSYDYTSGLGPFGNPMQDIVTDDAGLLPAVAGTTTTPTTPTPPGMLFQDLNGNLQITDLTSVAIDPTAVNTYYTTELNSGTAMTTTTLPDSWTTLGMVGPTYQPGLPPSRVTLPTPNGAEIIASTPAPNALPGTPTTLYREWQFLSGTTGLGVQTSQDGGLTFNPVSGVQNGIAITDEAAVSPAWAVNPTKEPDPVHPGAFVDQMLYGTQRVYISDDSGNSWRVISPVLDPNPNAFISAFGIAPSGQDVFYAGTTDGLFFAFQGGVTWANRSTGLPAGAHINNITVDPNNPNTVYVMLTTVGGGGVFKSTNAGQTWQQLTSGLSNVPAYALVVDPRPAVGASQGFLYLGTQTGVFISSDGGAHWAAYGQGLPSAAVVDLKLNPNLNELAAAIQGRGVFELSTRRNGPVVTAQTPTVPQSPGSLTSLTVTFDEPVDPRSFSTSSVDFVNTAARDGVAAQIASSPEYLQDHAISLYQEFLRRAPSQAELNTPVFNPLGPNLTPANMILQAFGELSLISDLLSSQEYYNDAVAGSFSQSNPQAPTNPANNATWLTQVYVDVFGVTAAQAPSTPGYSTFLSVLNNGTLNRQQVVLGMMQQDQPLANIAARAFNQILGTSKPDGATPGNPANINDPDLVPWIATLGPPPRGQGASPIDLVLTLAGEDAFYAQAGPAPTDPLWLNLVYQRLLNRPIGPSDAAAFNTYVTMLTNGEEAYLATPAGNVLPLSITPNAGDTTYTLTFAPQRLDGTYTLVVGPSTVTAAVPSMGIHDLVDQNGSFTNTGNAMNQNGNIVNGEFPGDRFKGTYAINTSDDGKFVSGLYNDLLGRPSDAVGFVSLLAPIDAARQQDLNLVASGFTTSLPYRVDVITQLFQTLLGRAPDPGTGTPQNPAPNSELGALVAAFNNGQISELSLEGYLVGGAEYFSLAGKGNNDPATWLNSAFQDILGRSPSAAEQSALMSMASTASGRLQLSFDLVFSGEGLTRTVTQMYNQYLGRSPQAISPSTGLPNEIQPYITMLLQGVNLSNDTQTFAAGAPSPSELALDSLLATPEYLQHVGNTNTAWANSLYTNLRPPGTPDAMPSDAATISNLVMSLYSNVRQAAVTTIVNSPEYVAHLVATYYSKFLFGSTPSAAVIQQWQAAFAAGARDEQLLASILSSGDYFSLNGQNNTWLSQVYNQLLGHDPGSNPNDPDLATYNAYLNYLNNQSGSPTQLQVARFNILFGGVPGIPAGQPGSQGLLMSDEYRRILIAGDFNTFLHTNETPQNQDVTNMLAFMDTTSPSQSMGKTPEQVIAELLSDTMAPYASGTTPYFLLSHPYP